MSADFGAIELVLSLFLAGLFGLTGYMLGTLIWQRANQSALLAVVLGALGTWAWVIFGADYPHVLAANRAALIADATLWPLCLGTVCGFYLTTRMARQADRHGDRTT